MTEEADAVTPEEDRPFVPPICRLIARGWTGLSSCGFQQRKLVRETLLQVQIEEESWVGRIMVPTEKSQTLQNGKRRVVETKLYPGYVFVEMKLEDDGRIQQDVFFLIETTGVGDFVGTAGRHAHDP